MIIEDQRDAAGRLALDGEGDAIDWVVEMARFDEETLFDRLAERGALPLTLMRALAEAVAALHARRDPGSPSSPGPSRQRSAVLRAR